MEQYTSENDFSSSCVTQAQGSVYHRQSHRDRPNTTTGFVEEANSSKQQSSTKVNQPRRPIHPFLKRPETVVGDHSTAKHSNFTSGKLIPLVPTPLGHRLIYIEKQLTFDRRPQIGVGKTIRPEEEDQLANASTQQNQVDTEGKLFNPSENFQKNDLSLEARINCPYSPLHSSFQPVKRFLSRSRTASGTVIEGTQNQIPKISILRTCGQVTAIPIDLVFNAFQSVSKLSEGVYGEVYTGHLWYKDAIPNVFKIVPVEGSKMLNDLPQKRYHEIESEIKISQRLNLLRQKKARNYTTGFAQLHFARILKGKYPDVLKHAWKVWDKSQKSMNSFPNYDERQRYIVFESPFCGQDLTTFIFDDVNQAWSCLIQVIFSLAVGERAIEFEHRDLHWGNVLIQRTHEPYEHFRIDGIPYLIPTYGIKSVIIDFTLARAIDINKEPIFNDLSQDEGQFAADGTDYQFEIYRMMRTENKNNWSNFHPKTNIFWIHYLCKKLIGASKQLPKTVSNSQSIKLLQIIEDGLLFHPSCSHFAKRQFDLINRFQD